MTRELGLPLFVAVAMVAGAFAVIPPITAPPDAPAASATLDMAESNIRLIPPAKRVVILPSMTGIYVTLDAGTEHLAAVSEYARQSAGHEIIRRIFPTIASLTVVDAGNSPVMDPEEIMTVRPDAVFAFPAQSNQLRRLGMPGVIGIGTDPRTHVRDGLEAVRLAGFASHREVMAQALIRETMAQQREILSRVPTGVPPLKIVILWGSSIGWFIPRNHFLNDRLRLLGAENAAPRAGGAFGAPNLERLLALDPDVILLDGPRNDTTTAIPQMIYEQPQFTPLRTVRERRVYKIPTSAFSIQAVDDTLLLRWLAEIFYPVQMDRSLRQEYRQTYGEVYHYALSEDEIDRALLLEKNKLSAGYDRFARPQNTPQ